MELNTVEHEGTVERVEESQIVVKILAKSACASCQLKGSCPTSEMEDKYVDIAKGGLNYKKGDSVIVTLSQKRAFLALFIGYILPFLIVLSTIIILSIVTKNEDIAGGVGLFTLIPYYISVYFLRDKISKKFEFKIKHSKKEL